MADSERAGILADDRVEVFVLHVDGTPAGYFELDRRDQPGGTGGTIDLAYFGLMAHCVGRGRGRYLLHAAIEHAWSYAPERLTVNTNTMDHPRALPLYQKLGFTLYRQEEQEILDPELTGIAPGGMAAALSHWGMHTSLSSHPHLSPRTSTRERARSGATCENGITTRRG